MNQYLPKFAENGIAVHGVTAQPGGDNVIQQMLKDNGCNVSFPIHSDPEMKLLACDEDGEPSKDIFVQNDCDKSRDYTNGIQEHEVQPAVIVADGTGTVTQWWSWKSLFNDPKELDNRIQNVSAIKDGNPDRYYDPGLLSINLSECCVEASDGGQWEEDKTRIVRVRPSPGDLLPAILADRPFPVKVYS
eukprot:gnl/MRDRNA2_/MRDRNA2_133397_c0_seq1.p1 gnl/MRDRNA2_/MRDRNA2_133397_c0~~gnl/MRDRNA2_/MRDRNA2_133397_c0_seq1.p1  ORF type:complete len:189 (+),score=29.65 gnl/MRDRNA2_/MRDRNA2_133397_c0_seq1:156-722(+)